MPFVTDVAHATSQICAWLRARLEETGRQEYVLGLSGGLDSALAAHLACEAVGREGLLAVLLPYRTSSPQSLADAQRVIQTLGLRHRTVEISGMVETFERQVSDLSPVRRGNLCARLRMVTLFDQSHARGLVLGTSNKTETLLGYGTLYGDAAWSLNPLGDLYKTDVRRIAVHVGVPGFILDKTPTADLWEGQTDEGELGFSYEELDRVLVEMIDEKKSRAEMLAEGVDAKLLELVAALIRGSAFKRKLPPIAWLSPPYSTSHIEDGSW
jgi:NAD+ synthase